MIASALTIAAGTSCGSFAPPRATRGARRRRSRARRRARPRAPAGSCRRRRGRSGSTSEPGPTAGARRPSRPRVRGRSSDSETPAARCGARTWQPPARPVHAAALSCRRRARAATPPPPSAGRATDPAAGSPRARAAAQRRARCRRPRPGSGGRRGRPQAPRPAVHCDTARASAAPSSRSRVGCSARSCGELAHQRSVRPAREVGLHARLQRHQALLLQARDLRRRERLELQVRQRRPMPQLERFAQHDPRALRIARLKRTPTLRHATREALGVKLARAHPQPVAGRRGASTASGSPSALRNRETCTCTVLTAPAGASSPHNPTARRSALTGSFACNNSIASTARGLRPSSPTAPRSPCTSSGPSI